MSLVCSMMLLIIGQDEFSFDDQRDARALVFNSQETYRIIISFIAKESISTTFLNNHYRLLAENYAAETLIKSIKGESFREWGLTTKSLKILSKEVANNRLIFEIEISKFVIDKKPLLPYSLLLLKNLFDEIITNSSFFDLREDFEFDLVEDEFWNELEAITFDWLDKMEALEFAGLVKNPSNGMLHRSTYQKIENWVFFKISQETFSASNKFVFKKLKGLQDKLEKKYAGFSEMQNEFSKRKP